jgi:hypothetical protein
MRSRIVALCTLLSAFPLTAATLDPQYWRGLDVQVEALPGQTYVNGVQLQIVRVSGADVARVSDRLLTHWRTQLPQVPLKSQDLGPWRIHSRIRNGASEVMQEGRDEHRFELLWSLAPLRDRLMRPPTPTLIIPGGCIPGQTVHGTDHGAAFLQLSAVCPGSPPAVLDQLRRAALRRGYRVADAHEHGFEARRASREIRLSVVAVDAPGAARSALVMLERDMAEATP